MEPDTLSLAFHSFAYMYMAMRTLRHIMKAEKYHRDRNTIAPKSISHKSTPVYNLVTNS